MFSMPTKTGLKICAQCEKPTEKELITLTRDFEGKMTLKLYFCCTECMDEYLYDERVREKIEKEVAAEIKSIHQLICPACRRRIL